MEFSIPIRENKRLEQIMERVRSSTRLQTLWECSNINALSRLNLNDHGPIHIKIITNIALKLLRLLIDREIVPSVVQNHGLEIADAEVIVVLSSLLHDTGHAIHRDQHEEMSVVLAPPLIAELIEDIYTGSAYTIIEAEVLHAIFSHRRAVLPFTVEAGVVKIADALDMEKGRARIPFTAGAPTIHSVSAMAITKVKLSAGKSKPVRIEVQMANSAGIFQLDNLLKEKLQRSGIAQYFEVIAEIRGDEKKIIEQYAIE
jgi:metal-dependent HD superfamily phosphatase/phosphodiesterase